MSHNRNPSDKASVVDLSVSQSIDMQAAAWMVRLEAENSSEQDIREFKAWVIESPAHREACEEMVEFWDDMNVLTQAVLPSEAAVRSGSCDDSICARLLAWLTRRHLLSAACAMALLVATIFIAPQFFAPSPQVYVTAVGEQKTIKLEDTSTVLLNTNSRLEVIYSDKRRQLKLTQGEAHFDVYHNPDRPFEVWAGKGLVRAVGTAFTVHVRKVDVEVIVTEGIIEIDEIHSKRKSAKAIAQSTSVDDDSAPPQERVVEFNMAIRVEAGNKIVYDREELEKIKLVVARKIEKDLSWRQGMLVFSGEPLVKVVEDVSRYTDLKIVIPERKTRELLVGGIFKVGDTESLFEVLRDGFGIRAEQAPDDVVYLISGANQ
jgi:transmembrane sensor